MSGFKPYPSYKNSRVEWLGEVPTSWKLLKLKRTARLQSGEFITSEAIEDNAEYPVYGGNGLRGYTGGYTHDGEYALIGRQGALCGNINYAAGRFWASEHAVVVYPEAKVVTRWLGELMRSMRLGQYSVSAAQPGLSVERIAELKIPLPSREEQTQIARFLDHETVRIDALIEEQQRLIELLKEKRQAVISHAVTKGLDPTVPMKDSGVEWLGEVPAHWEVVSLKRVVVFQRGHDLPSDSREEGSVPVISSGGYSGTHSIARAKAPGIVTGRYGSIGEFILTYEDYWPLNTALFSIELYGNKPRYIWYLLQAYAEHFMLNSLKSAVPGVDRNDIHEVKVAAAPIDEHDQIVAYIDRMCNQLDQLVDVAEKNTALLQERRSALISAAVTGKIDVRNWQPPTNTQPRNKATTHAALETAS